MRGIPTATRLRAFIEKSIEPISLEWVKEISTLYEKKKEIKFFEEKQRQLNRTLIENRRSIIENERAVKHCGKDIRSSEADLEFTISRYNQAKQQQDKIRRQLTNKRYTYCRNGYPYDRCTHHKQKARYDREVNELKVELREASIDARRLKSRIGFLRAQIRNKKIECREIEQRLFRLKRKMQSNTREFNKVKRKIYSSQRRKAEIRRESSGILMEINRMVTQWH